MLQNNPMFAEKNHENELWFCDMEKLVMRTQLFSIHMREHTLR